MKSSRPVLSDLWRELGITNVQSKYGVQLFGMFQL